MSMSGSVASSINGLRPATASTRRRPPPSICCNKCRKPLSTTVFVLSCDCVFCEECTYNHFNDNSNCPSCNRVMGEKDFTELVVSDPSTLPTENSRKSTFQTLFTKMSTKSTSMAYQDMCARLLRHTDNIRGEVKFVMKQLLVESNQQGHRSGNIMRAYEGLKQEVTKLKQAQNAQRTQYEKMITDLKNQIQAREANNMQLHKKLEEKERMLMQFRKLHDGMTIQSPTHNKNVHSPQNTTHSNSSSNGRIIAQQQPIQPPLRGFMKQKEANERARQQALEQTQQNTNIFRRGQNTHGTSGADDNGHRYITPIQVTHQQNSVDHGGSTVSSSPHIRDLSSSSGYRFTSASVGGGGSNGHINKRRRGGNGPYNSHHANQLSPSTAFAYNHQGRI